MALITRIWVTFVGVIISTVGALAVLVTLQHDATLSQLIRQRLSVTVEATARPFRSVVDMGLPVSMVRNKQALLDRARETDSAINDILLFDATGTVVGRSGSYVGDRIPGSAIEAQQNDPKGRWGAETDSQLVTGTSILDDSGAIVGGVLAIYPRQDLQARSSAVARLIGLAAAVLLLVFSGIGFVAVRVRVAPVTAGLGQLEATLAGLDSAFGVQAPPQHGRDAAPVSVIEAALNTLRSKLDAASTRYRQALGSLGYSTEPEQVQFLTGPRASVLVGIPEGDATRTFARRLTPVVLALTLGSSLCLGYLAYRSIDASFEPEIARRTRLIGTIATADIQRSLEAGVPVEALAGGAEYLEHVLKDFPEVSYFAIVGQASVLEVGLSHPSGGVAKTTFPILVAGQQAASVITESDPGYAARQLRNVVIDLGIVLLVIVLFSFELIVVMMTRSVTGPLDRLQYLAELQVSGDFSARLVASGRNVIERIGAALSDRAEVLNALWAARLASGDAVAALPAAGHRPAILRFANLADIRLPLFLFAMADELPLPFFSLYARAMNNPMHFLGQGVVVGLPLVAYLAAALVGAPIARPMGKVLGYRRLFVLAALATFASKIGLYGAGNIIEVIVFHFVDGFAFALASLTCQDYVLDTLPKAERSRSLSLFRTSMFSGVFAATALGGVLADRLGQRSVFAVCAALSLVAAALIWRSLPNVSGNRAAIAAEDPERVISFRILAPFKSAAFAAVALGSVVPLAIVDHVFISYLLALQMDALGANISEIARVMMCFFLALIVGGHAESRFPFRRAGPATLVGVCSLAAGAILLASTLAHSVWMTLFAAIGTGSAIGLAGGSQAALVMEAAEGPLAALGTSATLGAVRVIERGGAIAGLVTVSWITDVFGYWGAAGAVGVIALFGSSVFVLLRSVAGRTSTVKGEA